MFFKIFLMHSLIIFYNLRVSIKRWIRQRSIISILSMKAETETRRRPKRILWGRIRKTAIKGRRSLSMEAVTGRLKRM